MKQLTILLILLAALPSLATKARMSALANSPQLVDEQAVFTNIHHLNSLGTFASFESGITTATQTTTTTSNAEGMFGYQLNDSDTVVVALGHQDESVIRSRVLMSAIGLDFNRQQNPIHLMWGHSGDSGNYGLSLQYSHFQNKLNGEAESSSGLQFGYGIGAWRFYTTATLLNTVKSAVNTKFDGSGYISASLDYTGDSSQFYLRTTRWGAKVMNTTSGVESTSQEVQVVNLGLTDFAIKDADQFFWGLEVVSTTLNCRVLASADCDKKYTSTILPFWMGIEAEGASWLVIRGSIKQTILVNQSKDEVGYPAGVLTNSTGAISQYSGGPNSTVVAAGLGLKFSRVVIDGLLSAATTQQFNSTNLLTQVGLKYNF